MNSQLEQFCEEHGIVSFTKKPWYMTERHFEAVKKAKSGTIQLAYHLTMKMYERYDNYINVFERIARELGDRRDILTLYELPEIDYSDLEYAIMELRIACSNLVFGKSGGAFDKLFYQKNLVFEEFRHEALREAIHRVPKDKKVLVIKSGFYPEKSRRDKFDSEVEELVSNPSNRLISIKMGDFYEWLGFAPSCMKYDDLYEIVDNWRADPKRIEIRNI